MWEEINFKALGLTLITVAIILCYTTIADYAIIKNMKKDEQPKAIILRGLEPRLLKELKAKSQKAGLSVNKFVLSIIQELLFPAKRKVHTDLDHIFGKWTEEDFNEFKENTKQFEEIDPDLWEG